jgi:hypothetical protein
MNNCHKEALNKSLCYQDDYQEKKNISLETILNRPPIILVGRTTENFIKLLKEIYNGN